MAKFFEEGTQISPAEDGPYGANDRRILSRPGRAPLGQTGQLQERYK